MTKATDGYLTLDYQHLLSGDTTCYAHDGGLFVLFSKQKNQSVTIDPIGMDPAEVSRAMMAGDTILARAVAAPVNRKQRRAAAKARVN